MIRSEWKLVCLSLAITVASSVAWGQESLESISVAQSTAADDGTLFDTQLLSKGAACDSIGPVAPGSGSMGSMGANGSPLQSGNQGAFGDPSSNMASLNIGQSGLAAQSSAGAIFSPGGYLDVAAPVTMFRMRYDDAINNQFPDRGEYFYAKCGCFRQVGADPNAKGPNGLNQSVNYQDFRPYLEYAFNPKFSVFTELPVRFVDFNFLPGLPSVGSASGFSDMNAGFKYAFVAEQDRYITFQFRTYIPTGDSFQGLGTGHVSLEPSLLYYRRLSDRWLLQGQLTEFTPIAVSSYASDVVQYGAGLGYVLYQSERVTLIPMAEMVGWTFIGGQKLNPNVNGGNPTSASGDTIVNIKPGIRIGLGGGSAPMMLQKQSIYVGFGIPVTGDQFYSNLFRLEYRYVF